MKFKNKIIFEAQSEHVWEVREKPFPAIKKLPEWWKQIPQYSTEDNKLRLNPGPTVTVKKCFPTLDALGAGYIVPLWADLLVSQNNEMPFIQWGPHEPVMDQWPESQVSTYEIPDEFSSLVFKYLHGWIIKTPPGWSSFITHPIGYQNLPFRAISGIVDTDILETDINTPILIKKGFEGIIEKGTPMFQIIPFKRENWESDFILQQPNKSFLNAEKLSTKIISSYGRHLRSKKSYK
jgi:hypothetical protein